MMQKVAIAGILIVLVIFVLVALFVPRKPLFVPLEHPTGTPMYQSVGPVKTQISLVSDQLPNITQIEITPDGNTMLVGTLPGKVYVYQKVAGMFRRQSELFFDLATAQPGWPPEEAGLTGIVLGADFEKSGDVFLLHSFAKEKKSFRNRVMRVIFTKKGQTIVGTDPKLIFEANTPGTGSHQIQDGVGVMVAGKPHLLFGIGEGFMAERALDPKAEAGKVMLIDRDGGTPAGERPFPQNPKVQALGMRNPPAIGFDWINSALALGDTGPNNYDRFIYGKFLDVSGHNTQKLSFNWDGTEESLQKPALDLYDGAKPDMILHRWTPTETAVNIAFYENNKLPQLAAGQQYILVTLFGKTGEKNNKPGKSIMLATLTHGTQPHITFAPFIERAPAGEGKLGHPLGLAVDPTTKDIYFGDIIDGRLHKVVIE